MTRTWRPYRDAHSPHPAVAAASLPQPAATLDGCTCVKDGDAVAYPCEGMTAGEEAVITCTLPDQAVTASATLRREAATLGDRGCNRVYEQPSRLRPYVGRLQP